MSIDATEFAESARREGSSSLNQNGSRVDSACFFQFHLDILWEILLRLPIEAILRCQCVCRTWYEVVKNLSFISKQMKISSNQPPRIICYNFRAFLLRRLGCSSLVAADRSRRLSLLDIEDGKARKMPGYKHSCGIVIFTHHGLLCLEGHGNQNTFSICNPITSESIELHYGGELNNRAYSQVGFCYVPARQTYIVLQASILNKEEEGRVAVFYIKTSGQSAWRILKHPECITVDHMIEQPVYCNGMFFWKVKTYHAMVAREKCILSFDTVQETFQIISYPDGIIHDRYIHMDHLKLLILNGQLTLIERGESSMNLWQVTGDKVGEFRLVCRERYGNVPGDAYRLVSRASYNKNLLADGNNKVREFVVASNDMRPYKTLEIDRLPIQFEPITFNPSLFSPHSMGII